MFRQERDETLFDWTMLGDINEGRPNLGPKTDVAVYRLMQFTLRDTLIREVGVQATDRIFYDAGKTAGRHFYEKLLTKKADFGMLIEDLQEVLKQLGVGILKVEKANLDDLSFTLTVAEDLDCSGLPVCEEEICTYDEGFIAGLLGAHTQRDFSVREIDCWCSGDRVCRFEARPVS